MANLTNRVAPEVVSTPRRIIGSTIINHEVRCKLELSNDQYVMMDFFEKFCKDSKQISYIQIYEHIGMDKEFAKLIISTLFHKSLLETYNGINALRPSALWYNAFGDIKNEFDVFWASLDITVNGQKKHIGWTGSKQDALAKFTKARKEESFEFLIKQKHDYFQMIAKSTYRQVMGCSVFLNTTTKRYAEDWTKYDKNGKDHEPERKESKVDKKKVDNAF